MKTLPGLLGVLVLATLAPAQTVAPPGSSAQTIQQLSRSAQEQLKQSTEELTRLREQIATEKLPLAQELTALEEKLTQLRRKQDEITRQADVSNLDNTNIKAEIKARQDELTYIANLLDEYARTFESKINVSELQYCGPAIEKAKGVLENKDLSQSEKFTQQIEFVKFSIKRLEDIIGGMKFPGVGVDADGTVIDGQYTLVGPVALFHANMGNTAGLVIPQTNSTKPLIRPLEGEMQKGLATLAQTGEGWLPLDPSRGAALKALVQKTSLIHIFEKGGPIMWPLLLCSILALGTVLERIVFLMWEKFCRNPRALDRFFQAVTAGDINGAIAVGSKSRYFVVRALTYALKHKEQSLANALVYAQAKELKRYQRGIPILDTVITLAPLLGLLGTVTGMMGSFSIIGGELSAPGAITGGIAEALIATAFGLGIAITSLIPFNILNARAEEARHEIESAATQLELLIHPGTPPTTATRSEPAAASAPATPAVPVPAPVLTPAVATGAAAATPEQPPVRKE